MKVKKRIRLSIDNPVSLLQFPRVATVCEESRCPNRYECSSQGIATFMIGGPICTRGCRFCYVTTGKGVPLEAIKEAEKKEILKAVERLGLKYVVITSVARDDEEKALAEHFQEITKELTKKGIEVELLIPDFHGKEEYLSIIGESKAIVIGHNIETVKRLSKKIRPQGDYFRTLKVHQFFQKNFPHMIRKTGFMVGLGESLKEIQELLIDLKNHGVQIVTVGQYLQPSIRQHPVVKYYTEEEFQKIEEMISSLGFLAWEVGPFVRSSYMASRTMQKVREYLCKRSPKGSLLSMKN